MINEIFVGYIITSYICYFLQLSSEFFTCVTVLVMDNFTLI